jgi:hypothetical protein
MGVGLIALTGLFIFLNLLPATHFKPAPTAKKGIK